MSNGGKRLLEISGASHDLPRVCTFVYIIIIIITFTTTHLTLAIFLYQALHNPHRATSVRSPKHGIMIQMMEQLVQPNTILILTDRRRLGHEIMVLGKELSPKPPKHIHDTELEFRMGIHGARIEDHILGGLHTRQFALGRISRPQITMNNNRGHALAVIQMRISDEVGNDGVGRLLY